MVDEKGEWNISHELYLENEEWTITCSYRKFEQWGIFCCHSLRIFFCKDIKPLPEKDILKRCTRHARSNTMIDHGGKPISVDPRLENSKQYRKLCSRLLILDHDVSNDSEACTMVYEGVLELEKKVVVIRLNNQSHGTHGITIEATQHVVESSTSKDIGFKKKDNQKQKKCRCLKSWVDELKQNKRKVKPSKLQSSQHLMGSSTSDPLESY